jgi:hypothetical protein
MTCILLAINRFVEMCLPAKVAVKLYDGYRIYIWLSIPILEIICINLLEIPAFYSPKMHAWFFDPFNIVDSLSHPTMVRIKFTRWRKKVLFCHCTGHGKMEPDWFPIATANDRNLDPKFFSDFNRKSIVYPIFMRGIDCAHSRGVKMLPLLGFRVRKLVY